MKDDTQLIMEAIRGAVEKATQQIAKEEIKKAQTAIEQRVRDTPFAFMAGRPAAYILGWAAGQNHLHWQWRPNNRDVPTPTSTKKPDNT